MLRLTPTSPADGSLPITPSGPDGSIVGRAGLPSLHDDPQKIHQLPALLGMPPGTEVRVTVVAASIIVR